MKTLQLSEEKAKKLYPQAPPEWKAVLEESFTKEFFSEKITDLVKTFDDACNMLGLNKSIYNVVVEKEDKDVASIIAYSKLCIIARALNEGWSPDWSNSNQRKWRPWFEYAASGFRFFTSLYVFTHTYTPSRLYFSSEELSNYAGRQFIDLFNQYLN